MEPMLRHARWLVIAVCLAPAARAWAGNADDQYTVATGHYAASRWELAAETFTEFVSVYPDHEKADSARFYLGQSLVQIGRFADARVHFTALLKADPDSRFAKHALFRNGESAYLAGKTDLAQADLEVFHEKYPDDSLCAYVLPYLGEIALAAGDATKAREYFSQAIGSHPEGPLADDARFGLAQAFDQLESDAEAERLYRELIDAEASAVADRALFHLGLLQYEAGDSKAALETWNTLVERFPNTPLRAKASLGRGWALYRLQKYGEAAAALESLSADEKIGVEAQYWLGMTLRAQHQWRRAAETLVVAAGAAEDHPLQAGIAFHAGDSLLRVGDPEGATRHFDVVLDRAATSEWADDSLLGKIQAAHELEKHERIDVLAGLFAEQFAESNLASDVQLLHASALMALKKYAQAVGPLESYLAGEEPPQEVAALAELVTCFLKLDKIDSAYHAFQRLSDNYPSDALIPELTHKLAEAAYRSGDKELSARLFKNLAANDKPEYAAQGLSGRAWSQLQAGKMDEAAELFAQLLLNHPKSPLAAEAALTRGQILEQQDKIDGALAMYHRVIQEFSEAEELPEALLRAALIHDNLEQNQQAVVLYTRLVTQQPEFPRLDAALYGLAWAHAEMDSPEQSLQYFRRLHREYPKSKYWADSTYRLAEKASEDEQYDAASELLARLIESKPEADILAHALYLQGRVAARRELWASVEPAMAELLKTAPDSPLRLPAEYSIAEAAYRMNNFERADALLAELSKQIAGRKEAWLAMVPLRRAQVAAHFGRWDESLELAKELRRDFPAFARMYEVDYLRGRCFAARAQFEAARRAYLDVINSAEGSRTETAAMAQWMIGETYFHQEDYERARREYLRTEILYAYPEWQAAAMLQAGKCLEQLGRWTDAAELYSRSLKKYPDTQYTEEINRRLRVVRQRAASAGTAREANGAATR
jgi:TolA-binding protein